MAPSEPRAMYAKTEGLYVRDDDGGYRHVYEDWKFETLDRLMQALPMMVPLVDAAGLTVSDHLVERLWNLEQSLVEVEEREPETPAEIIESIAYGTVREALSGILNEAVV